MRKSELILVQPLSGPHEKLITVGTAGNFIAQFTHQGTPLMLTHPSKTKDRAGHLLVVKQRFLPPVQGAQRSQVRGGDAKFVAEMTPQTDRNHPNGIEQAATHTQKTDMQSKAQLVGITPARIDCLALRTIKGEKSLHLEVADIAGQLAHPQKRRVPALHREPH